MTELLWRRERTYFNVEILVGQAWVQQRRCDLESEAQTEAQKILRDPSVSKVRILENEITQRCSLVFEEEGDAAIALPKKMKPLHRNQDCPRCKTSSPVATDGTNEWIFCQKCGSAFPA